MSRKVALIIMTMVLFVVPMVAVNAQEEGSSVVGVMIPTTNGDFYDGFIESINAYATELGLEVVVLSAENDLEIEAENIETLIADGVSALLFTPTDAVESLSVIATANDAEIPVFLLSSELDLASAEVDVVSTIGMDNAVAATTAAEYICTQLEEAGNVIEIYNVPVMMEEMEAEEEATTEEEAETDEEMEMEAVSPAEARSEAFNAYFAESCTGVTVSQVDVSGMEDADALSTISEALNDDINAVYALNDSDILTAMNATIRARLNGVVLVGFNATEDTLGAIQIGRLNGVISPSGTAVAFAGLDAVAAFLAGDEIEATYALDPLVINADAIEAVRNCPPNRVCP